MSLYESSIDDNDSALIYSDGWILVTSDPPWSGTMHSTSVNGATMRVRFTGSAVAVICTIPTGGEGQRSMATFSIDGSSPVLITHLTTPPVQYQTTFWQANSLPMGSHVLEIKNAGTEAYFRLDRIDYDPTSGHAPKQAPPAPPAPVAPVTPVVVTSVIDAGAGVQSTKLVTVTPSATPTNVLPAGVSLTTSRSGATDVRVSTEKVLVTTGVTGAPAATSLSTQGLTANDGTAPNHASSNSPVAAIVGGVLGGLLFLFMLGIILFLLRRRRKAAAHPEAVSEQPMPFNVPQDNASFYSAPGSTSHLFVPTTEKGSALSEASLDLSPSSPFSSSSNDYPSPNTFTFAPSSTSYSEFRTNDDRPDSSDGHTLRSLQPLRYSTLTDSPPAYPGPPPGRI